MDLDLLKNLNEIASTTIREESAFSDLEAAWPERSLRALQAAGFGGLTVPKQYGGLGGGLLEMVRASEIIGRECASAGMCFGMHCVASAVIAAKATNDQAERFLVPIAKGEHITTLALSEPGTGAHFYIPEATMRQFDNDTFAVDGEKSFITNGGRADSYVVSTVMHDSDAPMGEFSLVVLSDNKNLEWQAPWRGFGMRGNSSTALKLHDVRVPSKNLLGAQGDQLWYVFEVVAPYFLMAMAGTYLGIAEAALNEAIAHLRERSYSHNGTNLAGLSTLQHKLGTIWSRLEATRRLVYHAAELGDIKDRQALTAILSSKAEVADAATAAVNDVMTLMGGRAYGENDKMSRLLRDVRGAHVMSPTTDLLRIWTGRSLLDLPLLAES
jgi:alkylation response protein AidB-like acyl-CoA dehydrogenase